MSPLKKITWILMTSSTLALVILVFFLTNTLQGFAVNQWVENRTKEAGQLSQLIDGELLRVQNHLKMTAADEAFKSVPDPTLIDKKINGIAEGVDSSRRKLLNWLQSTEDQAFNVLFVLMPNGDHYLSHPFSVQQNLKTYNLGHRPYFREATSSRKSVISDTFIGADGIPAVAILVPILDESGEITSHLGGVFHLSNLSWLVEDFGYGIENGSIFLLDESGAKIVSSGNSSDDISTILESSLIKNFIRKAGNEDLAELPIHKSDIIESVTGNGKRIVFLSRLKCGWTIGLESDLNFVSSQYQKPVWQTVIIISALLLIIGSATIYLAWKIGMNWQLAHGELQTSHDQLEKDVEERTQQMAVDVAAHGVTAAALQERENLFDAITNQSAEGITVADTDGKYTFVNPAFCEMMGYSAEELLQMTVFDVKAKHQDTSSFAKSKTSKEGIPFEVILQRKDGSNFHSEVLGKMIDIGAGKAVLGTIRDITDRIEYHEEKLGLERQMLHAQKLESLGVLAGGIAHDFNNLLMAILGNADLALSSLSPMSPARENLREIESASRRAAELSRQMLAYSGKGRFVVEPIALGELVEEIAHLLEVSISKKVVLKYNFAENLPSFDGDATQIRQIVLNLITNASEAINEKSGIVALSTGALDCDRVFLNSADTSLNSGNDDPLDEGIYVYLEVADTGCGMNEDTIHKVFDPFFTTKFTGRGLGMSAVQGIVRGHRGAIRVYSEEGKGTTFKILFKANELSQDQISDIPQGNEVKEKITTYKFSGTVLIADDEDTVCAVGKQMLERLGFNVIAAADGQEALDIFKEQSKNITCVLLDWTMPHLNGEEAFREMRRFEPDVKVILCSGYNEDEATQEFVGKGLAGFIQKPYTMALLQEKLTEVLG